MIKKNYLKPETTLETFDIGPLCVLIGSNGQEGDTGEASPRYDYEDFENNQNTSRSFSRRSYGAYNSNKSGWGSLW